MLKWLRQRKMTGGVVFGPPAWMPSRIETTFDNPPPPATATPPHTLPTEPRELAAFLEDIHLGPTSAITPPLADQLRALRDHSARTLILNLLPTQPEFALAPALCRLALQDLLDGFDALHHSIKPRHTLIVVDRHDHPTRRLLKRPAKDRAIELRPLLNRYPQSHPTILLRTLFGKRLPVDALPTRGGRILVDPVACWALGRFLRGEAPRFTERPVQLFLQERTNHPSGARLVMARIGETVTDLCRRFSVDLQNHQVILNGMLAGHEVDPDSTSILSSTESIAIRPTVATELPSACLACGWCVDVCPTALTPIHLLELAQQIPDAPATSPPTHPPLLRSRAARESLHCIGCGLCSYVCPTRLPLTQETVHLRLRVLAATHHDAPHHPRRPA